MKTWVKSLIVVIIILIIIAIPMISSYNNLVTLEQDVNVAESNIDTQLQRRSDLIPNLVNTVKGYAKHEEKTLEQVIEARNNYNKATTQDEKMAANNELSQTLSHLFAVAENYPDLKANTNFLELQTELQDTENKIAMARQFYNDTVLTLNNKIEMFPSNIIAGLFHFKKEEFFQAVEEERENVKVEF